MIIKQLKKNPFFFPLFWVLFLLISTAFRDTNNIVLENKNIGRTFSVKQNSWFTTTLVNKKNAAVLHPISCEEFKIRLSKGTDKVEADIILSSKDFQFISQKLLQEKETQRLTVSLKNKTLGLDVTLIYELGNSDFFMRKHIKLQSHTALTIERIDVESISFADAYQPYTLSSISTKSSGKPNWKPGLGQPLYTKTSGTFWGIEFPAATNYVEKKQLNCGYLVGKQLENKAPYTSYKAVVGVADDAAFIDDAFFNYIDKIRIRPLRLQVQYNSWFDFGKSVNQDSFLKSAAIVQKELVEKRNCRPLNAYVIDDGWEDSFSPTSDWSIDVWKTNEKFDQDFHTPLNKVKSYRSTLGLWLSPGVLFGSSRMLKSMKNQGYETLENSMSLSGPKYMTALKKRLLALTEEGISYYKFDGLFGHLRQRDFELKGRGTASMPQLNLEGITPGDTTLNNSKYDELKTYYLVSGTERLMDIFDSMAKINPNVYITISNGAYLSPWWLQHVDACWMINAGDAAKGSGRTEELTYRDGIYYEIWKKEKTKFPMNALFNHEPKKTNPKEDLNATDFQKYLLMNFSRGTGLLELYLKTELLSQSDWDVLAKGLKWTYQVFPTFKQVQMHGGNPAKKETYGYTAWNENQGYISFHNPSNEVIRYTIKLNKDIGVTPNASTYFLSSPLSENLQSLAKTYKFGDTIELTLQPKEIKMLNFSTKVLNWNQILK
ncbi:hypothetical protein [Pedobacter sp. MW01-1-1]|uniref:hypothetical protein n=1 Tax=Pedobacter sp. MW01-1-1 TaxID=3383027 RepID=UPI003FED70AF